MGNFAEWLGRYQDKNEEEIFPPSLDPQEALQYLKDYLLGEDWYITLPVNNYQANSCIVDAILLKYSKKYKKDIKKARKERRK